MGHRNDNFTRGDSAVTLGTPSDTGSDWVALSGTWGIDTNKGYGVNTNAYCAACLEASSQYCNAAITCSHWLVNGSKSSGPALCVVDDSNYFWIRHQNGVLAFFCKHGGTFSRIVAVDKAEVVNEGDTLEIRRANGSDLISGYHNGSPIDTFQDINISAWTGVKSGTKHGIVNSLDFGAGSSRYSAFAITDNAAAAGTFGVIPATIPANHTGDITLALAGNSTTWTSGSTVTVTNSLTGTTTVVKGTWNCIDGDSATLTVTTGAGAGTYKITIDGVDQTGTLTVATATLSVLPASGDTGTTPSVTLTGVNTLWSDETPAGLFTVAGGTGASIGTPTVNSDTSATATLTVGSAAGDLTIRDTSTGAEATFSATTPSEDVDIAVNAAGVFFSPYNWYVDGANYAKTPNDGAYCKVRWTGTSLKMFVDVSTLVAAGASAGYYPTLAYCVDGADAWSTVTLTSGSTSITLAAGLADAQHDITILWYTCAHAELDRWNDPIQVWHITKFQTSPSGSANVAPPILAKRAIWYGDSVTESVSMTGGDVNNARVGYPRLASMALNAEYGVVAYGSTGYAKIGAGNVPAVWNAGGTGFWDKYWAATTRLVAGALSPAPDYILCCHGVADYTGGMSDAQVQTGAAGLFAALRTAAPNARVVVVVPMQQWLVVGITAAFDAWDDDTSTLVDFGEAFKDLSKSYTTGNVHLDPESHALHAAVIAAATAEAANIAAIAVAVWTYANRTLTS